MLRAVFAFIAVWLLLGMSAAQADYWARWDRVGGGWTTGWVRHPGSGNVCGHAHVGCRCGGQSYCGWYGNGAATIWWPHGCHRPAWRIQCSIRPIADTGAVECRNYTTNAINQQNENVRRQCGYTGGRWHANYQAHYNWCVQVSPGVRAGETQARQAALAQCAVGPARGAITILSANYGQNCPDSYRQDPRYPGQKNITGRVAQACNGRAQCTYPVNHTVIGDPAYGCRKDFRVQYRCGTATKQAFVGPEASGQAARLSCP